MCRKVYKVFAFKYIVSQNKLNGTIVKSLKYESTYNCYYTFFGSGVIKKKPRFNTMKHKNFLYLGHITT